MLLMVLSARGLAAKKLICNETIMDAMATLRAKTPDKFKEAVLKCMEFRDKHNIGNELHCKKKFAACVAIVLKELKSEVPKTGKKI
ncbi:hypothetical protein TNCT_54021 [Trichonephila clavata]|uniref:Uncharacterized protein n=1 Tax=Trichonephila clavata TaxID=2740835 RepID=A0A8X6GIZ7_TRICU|nr:hypothetical protein TNCT_54021 [Trichonephila clavata]